MNGMNRIGVGIVVLVAAAWSVPAAAEGLSADDQLLWDAARALYGEGLVVKKVKQGVAISSANNGLTQDKYNRYVPIYLEALRTVSGRRKGTSFKWESDYSDGKYDPRAPTKVAMILLEPAFKFALCHTLAGKIGDKPTNTANWDRVAWCVQQGIVDATTNTCVYRGEATECAAASDHGDLKLDDPIFVKDAQGNYPMLVTVSGGRDHITQATISIAARLQDSLVSVSKLAPKIKADWNRRREKYLVSERAAVKQQRKLAKNQLAFSDQPFAPWEVHKPAKKVSCKTTHMVLFAPEKAQANDYYQVVSVDGKTCDEHPLGAGQTARDNIYLTEQCRKIMEQGPEHTVEVSLHLMKIGATSTKTEVKNGRLKDVTYEWGKAGKKLFGGKVTCTM